MNYVKFCSIVSNAFLTVGSLSSLLCAGAAGGGGGTGAGGGSTGATFFSFSILRILCWSSTCVLLEGAVVRGSPSSILTCCSLRSCNNEK